MQRADVEHTGRVIGKLIAVPAMLRLEASKVSMHIVSTEAGLNMALAVILKLVG